MGRGTKRMTRTIPWSIGLVLLSISCGGGSPEPPDAAALFAQWASLARYAEQQETIVVEGLEGWLFFGPELRHLSVGKFWGDEAAKVSRAPTIQVMKWSARRMPGATVTRSRARSGGPLARLRSRMNSGIRNRAASRRRYADSRQGCTRHTLIMMTAVEQANTPTTSSNSLSAMAVPPGRMAAGSARAQAPSPC